MENINDALSIETYNIFITNIHKLWCEHLMEVQDSKYDVSVTYDLSNHLKVPTLKRNNQSTSLNGPFHARFSVSSALLTPVKLRIYNCSNHHHCESVVYNGSMIDILIPKILSLLYIVRLFIVKLNHGFLKVDTTTLTQCLSFQLWKTDYTIVDNEKKTVTILSEQFCKLEKCPVCKNIKYGLVANKCLLIDLRKLKCFKVLKKTDVILGDLNILGWVVLKSDETFNDDLNEPLATICAIEKWLLGKVGKHWYLLILMEFGVKKMLVFHFIFLKKVKYDFSIAMCHLKTKYRFSLFDFKIYRPNLITNDGFIDDHQKTHRDFKVTFPNVTTKLRTETNGNI